MARHFDKILLAAAIAVLALTVLHDAAFNRDRDVMTAADAAIRESQTASDAYRKAARALHRGYSAQVLWTPPTDASPLKPWSGSKPPKIVLAERPIDPPKPKAEVRRPAVEIESIEAGVAAVRVAVKVAPVTGSVTALVLQRRGVDGDWVNVATLDAKAQTYDDAAIEPKTAYEYRVSPAGGPWSAPAAVTTRSLVSWRVSGVVNGNVTFVISIYVPSRKKSYDLRVSNAPGELIGVIFVGDREDNMRTTKHRVRDGREWIEIDADTGVTLVAISNGSITVAENGVERIVKYR